MFTIVASEMFVRLLYLHWNDFKFCLHSDVVVVVSRRCQAASDASMWSLTHVYILIMTIYADKMKLNFS